MNPKLIYLLPLILISLSACGQGKSETNLKEIKTTTIMEKKMKVEIWSDVMCPFCYIGKRKFEQALADFPGKDKIELEWKSYQLSPGLITDTTISSDQYLAAHKNIGLEEAKQLHEYVTNMASQVGLIYNMDNAVVANSFNAHRFSHFAKQYNKQNEAEEMLFKAYFTEGKNIDDYPTLIEMGSDLGLDTAALHKALESGMYADDVRADISEARQIGVRGVPFFVFNRKYAVSGAQDTKVFLQTLEKSFAEWRKDNPENNLEVIDGPACTPDGDCE